MRKEKVYHALEELPISMQKIIRLAFDQHKVRLDALQKITTNKNETMCMEVVGKGFRMDFFGNYSELTWNKP